MLYLIPRTLPTWPQTWDSIGRPHASTLAERLGVDERTVRRWHAAQSAPPPVMLGLYWLTPWGQSHLSSEQHNRATNAALVADAQAREIARLRAQVERLEAALSARFRPVPPSIFGGSHSMAPGLLKTALSVPAS